MSNSPISTLLSVRGLADLYDVAELVDETVVQEASGKQRTRSPEAPEWELDEVL